MEKNFKLIIEYDGSAYRGWQRQKEHPTVQAAIEQAAAIIVGERITLKASGRTDAGVHAVGQAANFHCDTDIPPDALQRGLNSLLPGDIVIRSCEIVPPTFHARFDARSKRYRYIILNRRLPPAVGRQYVWHVAQPLALSPMQAAAALIVGELDFKAFEGSGSPRSHTVRHVLAANLQAADEDRMVFDIQARGFLKHMVRNIVGTLVEVGRGKISPAGFERILNSRDRTQAGPTAPPQGLFLVSVAY